ncbi:hypothetical protein MPSI1_002985 [Malassezia psittaci]|uniref:Saccharopine dehydrogenase NADP binding domain-containing protein n=1 Tax=Malassezia psittaci TaxID=1821823 RepID=A0AAF0FGU4_9BASI|nr:hypothetical protein MPSI1_002985 [Malassezia psittaci]
MAKPEYDVALYGATGFTGKLIAQYLASHPQSPRIILAGRNKSKLQLVREQLRGVTKDRLEAIILMEATLDDSQSIKTLASSAKVLINAVGPYTLHGGLQVAQAVAEVGGSYLDLTGETAVYAEMVEKVDPIAKQTKAIIVPSAGFDSLPFDLTTFLAVEEVKKVAGLEAEIGTVLLGYSLKAGMSGGTLGSAVAISQGPEALRYTKPYWLSPIQGEQRLRLTLPHFVPQFNAYGANAIITPHNTRVVNRTWGLLEQAKVPVRYGTSFRYNEARVNISYLQALLSTVFLNLFALLLEYFRIIGFMAAKLLPPGQGPSLEQQLKGYLEVRTLASSRDGKIKGLVTFKTKGDPGYLKTAAFISEAALAIAFNAELLTPLAQQGGVVTPATLGALILRERLTKFAGVVIQARDVTGISDLHTI